MFNWKKQFIAVLSYLKRYRELISFLSLEKGTIDKIFKNNYFTLSYIGIKQSTKISKCLSLKHYKLKMISQFTFFSFVDLILHRLLTLLTNFLLLLNFLVAIIAFLIVLVFVYSSILLIFFYLLRISFLFLLFLNYSPTSLSLSLSISTKYLQHQSIENSICVVEICSLIALFP